VADTDIQRRSANALLWIVAVVALLLSIQLLFGWVSRPTAITTSRPATSTCTATLLADVYCPVAGASVAHIEQVTS
jgi:hypothetical protein